MSNTDINTLWSHFHDTFKLIDLTTKYIPSKTARKRCSLPWINAKLRRMIRKRNRLFSKYKLLHSPVLSERYKSLKHSIRK